MSTQPRYRHDGCQKGRGKPASSASGLDGFVYLSSQRATAAASNERFIEAQRRYELGLADRIEQELGGGTRGVMLAAKVEEELYEVQRAREIAEELTEFERQMLAVRSGAGIRTEPPMPRPEPVFTLGGVQPW